MELEGSLNVAAPAGVGVAGTAAEVVAECDGAGGAAGVVAGARAGVSGTALALEEAAGAAAVLGWSVEVSASRRAGCCKRCSFVPCSPCRPRNPSPQSYRLRLCPHP